MAIVKIHKWGKVFTLSLPKAYVNLLGIRDGDIFEVILAERGVLYRKLSPDEVEALREEQYAEKIRTQGE
jgi:antitoxin component of MazEF toxin-antitoxin module